MTDDGESAGDGGRPTPPAFAGGESARQAFSGGETHGEGETPENEQNASAPPQGGESEDSRLGDGADLEIAKPEDFGIQRDEDADLLPVKQRIPGTDKAIKVRPVTPAVRNEFSDVLQGGDPEARRVAELFDRYIVEGIGSDIDPTEVQPGEAGDLPIPYGLVPGLIQAIKNSSGEQVFQATTRQREGEARRNLNLMREMGVDVEKAIAEIEQSRGSGDSNDRPTSR